MTKHNDDEIDAQDSLDILQDAMRLLKEAGLVPQFASRPAKGERPEGVLVFLPFVKVDESGRFVELQPSPAPLEETG